MELVWGLRENMLDFGLAEVGGPGDRSLNKKKQQEILKGLTYNFKEKVFTEEMFIENLPMKFTFFKAI